MKKLQLMCFLLGWICSVNAQNLVPNHSFEKCNEIPVRWAGTFSKFNRWIKNWSSPTQGSTDIIFEDLRQKIIPPRAFFDLAPHLPLDGKIMIGIKTYGCSGKVMHCREYLQIKLMEPLIHDAVYRWSVYVNPLKYSIMVNNFGVAFSSKPLMYVWDDVLEAPKPLINHNKIMKSAPGNWELISGTFTADSSYQYMIMGNFFTDEETKADEEQALIPYSFLLIDEVSLVPLDSSLHPMASMQWKSGETLTLRNIQFDSNKAILRPESYEVLNRLVEILKNKSDLKITINGHTDNVGSEAFNLDLSKRRAKAVKTYLIEMGVEAKRLLSEGFGENQPVDTNETEEGRFNNRRVEFTVR